VVCLALAALVLSLRWK